MSRSITKDLNNPNLFNEFKEGKYEYTSIDKSKNAFGCLTLSNESSRNPIAQKRVDSDNRRFFAHEWGKDEGGHLIGTRFGGSSEEENLFAQNINMNRSAYKKLENKWAEHLKKGDKVFVNIESSDSNRTEAVMGYYIIETLDGKRDWKAFHLMNESNEQITQWEEDYDAFSQSKIDQGNVEENCEYDSFDSAYDTDSDLMDTIEY